MTDKGLAFLTGKGLAGLVAAILAVGGSAVVATAATGSANPAAWGQHVKAAVEGCKDQAGNAGRCVSASAKQHSEKQRVSGEDEQDEDDCQAGQNEPEGNNNDEEGANGSTVDSDQDEANESGCDNDQEGPNQASDKKASSKTTDDARQVTRNVGAKDDGNDGDHGHPPGRSPK